MNIFPIGETTEGKNLCSNIFENTQYNWEIHPIIGYVANKKDEGNYGNVLTPDVIYDELDDLENLAELGSVDDHHLKRSLKIIRISFDDNTNMASRSYVNNNVVKTERVRAKRTKYETIIVE